MSTALTHPEDLPADHVRSDTHIGSVGGDSSPEQAMPDSAPIQPAPARSNFPADQGRRDAHATCVGGDPSSSGHYLRDTQDRGAAAPTSPAPTMGSLTPTGPASEQGTPAPEQAIRSATPRTRPPARAPFPPAPANSSPSPTAAAPVLAETDSPQGSAIADSAPMDEALSLADPVLAFTGEILDDLEEVKNANLNRLRLLTTPLDVVDKDGHARGLGLPPDDPRIAQITASVDLLAAAEHQAELTLKRMLRAHPLGPWCKQTRGVGEKQLARLLAMIGDPYWNIKYDRPRTVSELWAYCGYRPGQRRRVGQKVTWSPKAKSRAYLIADRCVWQLVKPCAVPDGQKWADHVDDCRCSPYRVKYDQVRAAKTGSVHPEECVRCGPKGSPAPAGSPRSDGHIKQMALRVVAKEVLKDLWREAKRIHEEAAGSSEPNAV